ncbi:MAG TPA: LacI family DNA-binding transcriptional regulator [Gaiellaceae bacterium]
MTARPITLADVAREAGTSASTASRALSGRGYVAPDVRKRLLAVADRLGYIPNLSARTLKQRTSRGVGVVVSDLGNQFYAALAAGIEQTLREAGYQMLLLGDNSDAGEELTGVRTFLSMRAPGVIMTPASNTAADLLVARGTPVVEVDRRLAASSCDAVVIDNERGARDAVEHLLQLGHTRIGLLMARTTWTTDAGRLQGYRAALTAAGLKIDRRLIVKIATHAADATARIDALLDERPTAIFAANNQLAEQAWQLLRKRKQAIPRDISLVAFDDVPWMGMVQPAITAVAQPTFEMGRRAALLLLRRLEDPTCGRTVEVLEPRLIIRGSTGGK